jgi:hypothetical protein
VLFARVFGCSQLDNAPGHAGVSRSLHRNGDYAFVEELNLQLAAISRRDAMSVKNRKNPPPPPKSANLAGNYGTIGISAVKAAARYSGSFKGPCEPTRGLKIRDSTERRESRRNSLLGSLVPTTQPSADNRVGCQLASIA